MGNLGCLRGCRPAAWFASLLTAAAFALQSSAIAELWTADFPAIANGSSCQSTLVPLHNAPLLVTVVTPGANPMRPQPQPPAARVSLRVIGHDPVSRLCFLEAAGAAHPPKQPWLADARSSIGTGLRSLTPNGLQPCRVTGWVKQIGGKVLPLALLQVDFEGPVPSPGTPLLDPQNRVVAVVFQKNSAERTGYAIPAEAVHRVQRDVCQSGMLVRGWLGLTLNASNPSPRVVRVLPDSPASSAGIQPGDLLLQVGSRSTADYADVANAFFYLVPGERTRLSLMRGTRRLDITLTPSRPR